MEWTCPFCKGNKKAADLEPAANQSRIRGRNFRGITKIRHIFAVADFLQTRRPCGQRASARPDQHPHKNLYGGDLCPLLGLGVVANVLDPCADGLLPAVQSMRLASVNSSIQQNRSQGNSAVCLAEAVQGRARRAHPCKLQL